MPKSKVIAIDGPAGAGKSTVAQDVARRLKFIYLDTGAMYRALTLKVMQKGISLKKPNLITRLAKETAIKIIPDKNNRLTVFLDGKNVTKQIRYPKVTQNVSYIAKIASVRKVMVKLQRSFAKNRNIVAEGRDIGTVVFPKATKKFYLDADFKERTKRRLKDLKKLGQRKTIGNLQSDLKKRDKSDMTRKFGPLKKAKDAIYIDTTNMSIKEVVNTIIDLVNQDG